MWQASQWGERCRTAFQLWCATLAVPNSPYGISFFGIDANYILMESAGFTALEMKVLYFYTEDKQYLCKFPHKTFSGLLNLILMWRACLHGVLGCTRGVYKWICMMPLCANWPVWTAVVCTNSSLGSINVVLFCTLGNFSEHQQGLQRPVSVQRASAH